MEMRLGLICQQQSGFPSLSQSLQENQQFASTDNQLERAGSSQFLPWSSQQATGSQTPDVKPTLSMGMNNVNSLGSLLDMKSNGKDNLEEIEVMSTDSSSSSSSDSQ